MVSFLLAQGVGSGLENSLTPIYYGIGILALIVSGLWALKRYTDHQRQENITQGTREQQLFDKLDANTKAADKNTASIEKLGEKFDSFSSAIDKRLTLADYRLDKLEEKVSGNGFLRSHVKRDEGNV